MKRSDQERQEIMDAKQRAKRLGQSKKKAAKKSREDIKERQDRKRNWEGWSP